MKSKVVTCIIEVKLPEEVTIEAVFERLKVISKDLDKIDIKHNVLRYVGVILADLSPEQIKKVGKVKFVERVIESKSHGKKK